MHLYQLSIQEKSALIRYAASRGIPLGAVAEEYTRLIETSWWQDQLARYLASFSSRR